MGTFSWPDVPVGDASRSAHHLGPNFVVLADGGAAAQAACTSQQVAKTVLSAAGERMREVMGLDPQILVVLSTSPLACGDIFYVPLANDVRGIGYQHETPSEIFDDSTGRLEGIAFLNDLPYWQANPDELARDFAHEIGHRWSARVHAMRNGTDSPLLLGRQSQHWPYYLDTGGSPMEGNAWSEISDGHFRADTPLGLHPFSDFDLYLMGVLPPAEVQPERLLVPGSAATDCLGNTLTASSPPQTCGPLDIAAQAEPVSIEAVVAAEGPRVPAPDPSPRAVDMAVLLLESDETGFDAPMCESLVATLRERAGDFASATRGRLVLHNLVDSDVTCAKLVDELWPQKPPSTTHGCALAQGAPSGHALPVPAGLLLVLLSRRKPSTRPKAQPSRLRSALPLADGSEHQ